MQTVSEVEAVSDERTYLATMILAARLLDKGGLTEKEYDKIDTIFRKKYGISLSTLSPRMSLIKTGNCGNMSD